MMTVLKRIKRFYLEWAANRDMTRLAALQAIAHIDPNNFSASQIDPSLYYHRAFQDFHHSLPDELRIHRTYFRQEGRGYGEDAFHVMWWLLLNRLRPAEFLEIGVYRGQTLSLAALVSQLGAFPCEIHGISPFSAAGDSVSKYHDGLDYFSDVLSHFDHFSLPHPTLLKAYSTDPAAITLIQSRKWDCIYIDGNHDYEVVAGDWKLCAEHTRPGGCIVLDDSGLGTAYRPPRFATAGHPGPSRVAGEIDRNAFTEILQVGHNRVFRRNES
jgi:Methyltransferase domain